MADHHHLLRTGVLVLVLAFATLATLVAALPTAADARKSVGQTTKGHGAALADAKALSSPGPCSKAARRNLMRKHLRNLSGAKRRVALQRVKQKQARVTKRCKPPKQGAIGPGGPMYWGAWVGSQLTGTEAPWDMGALEQFEQLAGKRAAVVNFSSPFADCSKSDCPYYPFPADEMERIRERGSVPFFSWASQATPATLNQPDFQLADVLEGRHDAYIRSWAEEARDWGEPFFLRFNWEMNGNWFAWSESVNGNRPGESAAVWRHVVDIFRAVGATNATWVWCPNVDPYAKLQDLASLYPGDAYVDWTGLDGYNWGTNPTSPKGWMSFDELFRSTYDAIVETIAPGKPMIISEIGSTEHGGSKADWIADALHTAATEYPQLRGLLWFEKYDDGMDWPIETSASAASAFAAGISHPGYLENSFATLAGGPIQPVG